MDGLKNIIRRGIFWNKKNSYSFERRNVGMCSNIGGRCLIEKLQKPDSHIGTGIDRWTKIFLVMSTRNSKSFQSSKHYILLADVKRSILAQKKLQLPYKFSKKFPRNELVISNQTLDKKKKKKKCNLVFVLIYGVWYIR